jgi:VanZ family protein
MLHIKHLLGSKNLLLLAVFYTCGITVLFFIPSPDLPKIEFSAVDKIAHCLLYFILINLWLAYFYIKMDFQFDVKWIVILLLSVLLYGIVIEMLQGMLTVSRSADIYDVCANLTGSLLGIFFFKQIKHIFKI